MKIASAIFILYCIYLDVNHVIFFGIVSMLLQPFFELYE